MKKNAKCYHCDNAAVVLYWYGCDEDQNELAACVDHERSLDWARLYSFRIERLRNGATDLEEIKENMYVSKDVSDRIKNEMVSSRADFPDDTWALRENRPLTSPAEERELLIDRIIAALPRPPVVLRSVFDNWTLGELRRFAPEETARKPSR